MRALAAMLLLVASGCAARRGEIALSAYAGRAWNSPSDLRLRRPGTDLTLEGVDLEDRSFEGPIHYGLRGTYWIPPSEGDAREGRWGVMLDFTHAKAVVDEGEVVRQRGVRDGAPVHGSFPVSDSIESYELSHGHNLLTLNAVRRWLLPGDRDGTLRGSLRPYVGLGAGAAIPHVEATVAGVRTEEYQLVGWTAQGLAGLGVDLTRSLSAFVEYKLNWADVDASLSGGGSVRQEIWTQQLLLGLTFRF
jgi:lipid A oxidase